MIISSCKSEHKKPDSTGASSYNLQTRDPTLSTNDLYKDYYSNPATPAEVDQNAIIDYIALLNEEVKRSPTGLYYRIENQGTGDYYKVGDKARVDYKGYLLDGRVFDSSYDRGRPIDFTVGEMISGFNEVMYYLQPGGAATVYIPSRLGYGERGIPDLIPANSPLIFEVKCRPLRQ